MEVDQSEGESARKSDELRTLSTKGPLSTSIAKLSGSSRILPGQKEFHFYNNFQEFKTPVREIDDQSRNLIQSVGSLESLFGKPIPLPDDKEVAPDEDAALDWLVNVNDETFERLDVSLDEFKRLRKKQEESGVRTMRVDDEENGFQMVYGKKNKKLMGGQAMSVEAAVRGTQEAKIAAKVKPKIPFHIPTIPRPQDEYKIIVNNSNQPFEHVWLQRSEDGSRFVHPLEKLSVLDFISESESATGPLKPLPLEVTPFKHVEEVKDLKQLATKLRSVGEFAVDLEHNQYRSFQGLTCLMQISTRNEDFVIDTLKLRVHIGPYLREVFKDPKKRKVMHGADRDIVWLQRDFGIYVCNMFDTGQASRVLKMERYSLEHLLYHFCGVVANKEYQNADWRIRPLPQVMVKYAREDTHYLLYIYDLMRARLLETPANPESSDPPLIEVYKRSYDICTQLYEKELLTETSYLHIYGMQDADFNAQQHAIVSGLCEWRDTVARTEDESTGYVLPNRTLIEIAKQMPLTVNQLRRALKSRLPYIERNLNSVVSVIRHSIQNAAAFEEASKQLKERRKEMLMQINEENMLATEESDVLTSEASETLKNAEDVRHAHKISLPKDAVKNSLTSMQYKGKSQDIRTSNAKVATRLSPQKITSEKGEADGFGIDSQSAAPAVLGEPKNTHTNSSNSAEVTVQILKKPSRAFGALLGSTTKRKFDPDKKGKEDTKLEEIKSTVSLPFHTFSGGDSCVNSDVKSPEVTHKECIAAPPASGLTLEDVIILDDDSDVEELAQGNFDAAGDEQLKQAENIEGSTSDSDAEGDEPMSVSDLSSSFEKCFPPLNQSNVVEKSPPPSLLQVKPFDYEAARQQVKFGEKAKAQPMEEGDDNVPRNKKKGCGAAKSLKDDDDGTEGLSQGRRRQAFPASGNRSSTFR